MTINVYRHTDASAPAMSASAGALIAILDFGLLAAGWTKSFSGTNLATYKPPAGNGFYFAIDDTAAAYARLRGFETVTEAGVAVSAGTGPMPTDAQLSGGAYLAKTSTAGWTLVVSDRSCYLVTDSSYRPSFFWGDLAEGIAGDVYNTALVASDNSSASSSDAYAIAKVNNTATPSYPHWIQRSYTGLGGAVHVEKTLPAYMGDSQVGNANIPYPSPVEGGLLMVKVPVQEYINATADYYVPRGVMPGMWGPLHRQPLAHGDTFDGTGAFVDRSFVALNLYSTSSQAFFETTDGWYA